MDILLINTNPIVSKLFKSFVEDKMMQLQEVLSVNKVKNRHYDVIFIDESLCEKNLTDITEGFGSAMKVCISYALDPLEGFDTTLQKPFLPSQIMDILEDVSVLDREILSVLDNTEIEKIKSLLDMENLDAIDLGIDAVEQKPKNKKNTKKQNKNFTIRLKKLKKKEIKRLLKGKEIKIRIQLTEEF